MTDRPWTADLFKLDMAIDAYERTRNPQHLAAALSAAGALQRALILERLDVEKRAATGDVPYLIITAPRRAYRRRAPAQEVA